MKNIIIYIFYKIPVMGFLILLSCGSNQNVDTHKNETTESINSIIDSVNLTRQETKIVKSKNIEDFIPEGYTLLDSASGNLNLDEYSDIILLLKKLNEKEIVKGIDFNSRPLLILTGNKDGELTEIKRNDSTVLCLQCGGVFGDPYEGITIRNGYFSIEHFGGSSWKWTLIITYKYSKENNNWYLHKYGGESFNSLNIKETKKEQIKTTEDFGVVLFEDFNIDKAFD